MPCRGPSKTERRLQEKIDQLQLEYERLENEFARSKTKHEEDTQALTDRMTQERRNEVEAIHDKAANDMKVTLDRLALWKEEEIKRAVEDTTASMSRELQFRIDVAEDMKKEVEKLKAQLETSEEAAQVKTLKEEVTKLEELVETLESKLQNPKRAVDDASSDDGQKYWSSESYHKYSEAMVSTAETTEEKLQRLRQENDELREQIKHLMMNESNCAFAHQRAELEEIPGEIPCGLFLGLDNADPVDTECEFVCAGHSRKDMQLTRAPSPENRPSTAAISCLRPSKRQSTKKSKVSHGGRSSTMKHAEVQCDRPYLTPPRPYPYKPSFKPYNDIQVNESSTAAQQPTASSAHRGQSLPPHPASSATAGPMPAQGEAYMHLPPQPQSAEELNTFMKDHGSSPHQLWFYGGDVPFTMSVYQARMKVFDRMLELLQKAQETNKKISEDNEKLETKLKLCSCGRQSTLPPCANCGYSAREHTAMIGPSSHCPRSSFGRVSRSTPCTPRRQRSASPPLCASSTNMVPQADGSVGRNPTKECAYTRSISPKPDRMRSAPVPRSRTSPERTHDVPLTSDRMRQLPPGFHPGYKPFKVDVPPRSVTHPSGQQNAHETNGVKPKTQHPYITILEARSGALGFVVGVDGIITHIKSPNCPLSVGDELYKVNGMAFASLGMTDLARQTYLLSIRPLLLEFATQKPCLTPKKESRDKPMSVRAASPLPNRHRQTTAADITPNAVGDLLHSACGDFSANQSMEDTQRRTRNPNEDMSSSRVERMSQTTRTTRDALLTESLAQQPISSGAMESPPLSDHSPRTGRRFVSAAIGQREYASAAYSSSVMGGSKTRNDSSLSGGSHKHPSRVDERAKLDAARFPPPWESQSLMDMNPCRSQSGRLSPPTRPL